MLANAKFEIPEIVKLQLWELLPTVVYFVVGVLLFGGAIWLMGRIMPFSIRKEIEEDQNVALAILMSSFLISIAIILASVIR
ncbi:MAG: DUF350 domain-containing protein [Phycisphaerae bacterium]|nr:DUF350 domain-containing protein [Phycisphaerae bacterium]